MTRMRLERVPITRLKARLAHYLGRLKAGHTLVITDREQGVAVFEPVSWDLAEDEAMSQLVRSGQMTPPDEELPEGFFEMPRVKDSDCSIRAFLSEEVP